MRLMFELWWSLFVSTTVVWVGEESGSSVLLGILFRFSLALLRRFKSDVSMQLGGPSVPTSLRQV